MENYLGLDKDQLNALGAFDTAKEIHCQPQLWQKTWSFLQSEKSNILKFLDQLKALEDLSVILTGAGTSAFIGEALQGFFQKNRGWHTRAVGTTEIVTHPELYFEKTKSILLVSFARSGDSPESIKAVDLGNQVCETIFHLIITCNPKGELAKRSTGNKMYAFILPPEANDKSLAMTGSFTSMLLSGLLISKFDQLNYLDSQITTLVSLVENIFKIYLNRLKLIAELPFKRAVFLGSGPFRGIAQEAHLKMQELTAGKVISKFDSFLGFRHGPKAVINNETLLVFHFSNDEYVRQYEKDLLQAINKGEKGLYRIGIMDSEIDEDLDLKIISKSDNDKLSEEFLMIFSVVPAQVLAFFKSMALGFKPDTPSESGTITRVVQGVTLYSYNDIEAG